jgi:hypothetical protein
MKKSTPKSSPRGWFSASRGKSRPVLPAQPDAIHIRELAQAVGRAKSTVSDWLKRPDWRFGVPPWPKTIVPAVRRWIAATLTDDRGPLAPLRRQKLEEQIRQLTAQANQAEAALIKQRSELCDSAECAIEAQRRIGLYRAGIAPFAREVERLALAHGVPEENIGAFRDQLNGLVDNCLRHVGAQEDTSTKGHDDDQ